MKDLSELLQLVMDARAIVRAMSETEEQAILDQTLLLATRKIYSLHRQGRQLSFIARGYKAIKQRMFKY